MLMNLEQIVKSGFTVTGALHIGAHFGQEVSHYRKLNVPSILFEPHPSSFEILTNHFSNDSDVILVNKALGREQTKVILHCETANQGQSSSILKPKKHINHYPHIKFQSTVEVEQITLDSYMSNIINSEKYNFINMDVQGYELEVLKGSTKTLEKIDHIMTEVNWDELYEGCAHISDLDRFLEMYGFKRLYLAPTEHGWGDAFYSKRTIA